MGTIYSDSSFSKLVLMFSGPLVFPGSSFVSRRLTASSVMQMVYSTGLEVFLVQFASLRACDKERKSTDLFPRLLRDAAIRTDQELEQLVVLPSCC